MPFQISTRSISALGYLSKVFRIRREFGRTGDLAARFSPSSVALLLIDAETRAFPMIHKRIETALQIDPLAIRGQMSGLTLSAGGACYPQTASSGSELLGQAADLLTRAKKDGGNRLYLPS